MAEVVAVIGIAASSLGVLLPACKAVEQMVNSHSRLKFAKKRCKAVIQRAAFVVRHIHQCSREGQTPLPSNVEELQRKFEEIQAIIQRLSEMSFFKALLRFDDINMEINLADQYLTDCLLLFQIDLLFPAQADKDEAAKQDRADLLDVLKKITGNYAEIRQHLGLCNDEDQDHAMAVMERKLTNTNTGSQDSIEMQVLRSSFECIKATTGEGAPKQNRWLITKYDLDDRGMIGGGGFSTVSKAQFRGTTVAVKRLKEFENMKEALEAEIEIWSRLRHDHIVPFYGASTLTHPPYLVSRYMSNGNLVQYLAREPSADRTKLIFETSLGMFYLHEEQVIHGDLKCVNVLVDDAGKACITDFGLSKIWSSTTAGTTSRILGTLRYLAPEALKGQPLTFETDVFAFGMLMYEAFTGEVPFIKESDDKVREGSLELCRPTATQVYQRGFNDAIWELLSKCIFREASVRPRFQTIKACLRLFQTNALEAPTDGFNPIAEGERQTSWTLDSLPIPNSPRTTSNSLTPLINPTEYASPQQTSFSSFQAITQDVSNILPVCIEVTVKYFGVKFGISKREPGVYLEENNSYEWQPIKPAKRSLLQDSGAQNYRFEFQSRINKGTNSWTLEGREAILQSTSILRGVCCFNDRWTAQQWFALQLSFARDGTLGKWGTSNEVTGDWFQTVRSWRRFQRGKVQKAALIEGAPNAVPPSSSWKAVDLPKRWEAVESPDRTENHTIVCTTDPGTAQPGKFCCKVEGHKILLETYRRKHDRMPIMVKEEVYPSVGIAGAMFQVLKMVLYKVKGKH